MLRSHQALIGPYGVRICAWLAILICLVPGALKADDIKILGSLGCEMVLKPTEISNKNDLVYSYNLVSAVSSSSEKKDITAAITDAMTGDFRYGSSSSNFASNLSEQIRYTENHDFAASFLGKEQLDTYLACLRLKNGGVSVSVENLSDDRIDIRVAYHPGDNQIGAQPIDLSKKIEVSGAKNIKMAIQKYFEKNFETNEERISTFERTKNKDFIIKVNWSRPIEIVVPVLPKFPCVALDRSAGVCTRIVQFGHFVGLGNSQGQGKQLTSDVLPTNWNWKSANIIASIKATYRHPSGAAGVLFTSSYLVADQGELILGEQPIPRILFTPANPDQQEFGRAWVYNKAKGNFNQIGMIAQACYGRTDLNGDGPHAPEYTTCDVDVGFIISLIPQQQQRSRAGSARSSRI